MCVQEINSSSYTEALCILKQDFEPEKYITLSLQKSISRHFVQVSHFMT